MYEGTFIFPDKLLDDELDAAIASAAEEITNLKGTVSKTEKLGRRQFARPMKKQNSGHYVRLSFDAAPEAIAQLHARYKLSEHVFRVQIVTAQEIPASAEKKEVAENADA